MLAELLISSLALGVELLEPVLLSVTPNLLPMAASVEEGTRFISAEPDGCTRHTHVRTSEVAE